MLEEKIMPDLGYFQVLLESTNFNLLILVFSIGVLFLIIILNNRNIEKSVEALRTQISQIKESIDIHGTYLKQFNDHFGQLDQRLKAIEEITTLTGRDISTMADGITGEVGVGKAIELARRGASVDEIMENSNLKRDQAELIFKFHGTSEL